MALKERLIELIEKEGLNPNQFYLKTGLGNGFLNSVGIKLKRPSIEKINKAFPHWNIDYLQTGKGNNFLDFEMKEASTYINDTENDNEKLSKALTWMIFSSYNKQHNSHFSFKSFKEVSEILEIAAFSVGVLQTALETDIFSEIMISIQKKPVIAEDGSFVIDDSVTNVIDKYVDIYNKLNKISSELLETLTNGNINNNILKQVISKDFSNVQTKEK